MSEVQEKKKNEISTNLFEADAGQGLNMTQEDLALPFLKVLGQLSPECNKRDAKHVEGAEPGMIINTVTGEVYDGVKGIDVVPVHYKRQHIEWQDRGESQGAPVKIYDAALLSSLRPKDTEISFLIISPSPLLRSQLKADSLFACVIEAL